MVLKSIAILDILYLSLKVAEFPEMVVIYLVDS